MKERRPGRPPCRSFHHNLRAAAHGPSLYSLSSARAGDPSTHSRTCHQPRSRMVQGGPGPYTQAEGQQAHSGAVALPGGGRLGGRGRERRRDPRRHLGSWQPRGRHLGVGRPALAPGLLLAPWGSRLFSKLPDPGAAAWRLAAHPAPLPSHFLLGPERPRSLLLERLWGFRSPQLSFPGCQIKHRMSI